MRGVPSPMDGAAEVPEVTRLLHRLDAYENGEALIVTLRNTVIASVGKYPRLVPRRYTRLVRPKGALTNQPRASLRG